MGHAQREIDRTIAATKARENQATHITINGEPQQLFEEFNQQYFGSRLPAYSVIVSKKHGRGHHGLCRTKQREIHLGTGVGGGKLHQVLLHEMCHAATNGGHGGQPQAEMKRLADREASVATQLPSPVPVEFAQESAPAPEPIRKVDTPAAETKKPPSVRELCGSCNRIVSGAKGEVDQVVFVRCASCTQSDKWVQSARMVEREVTCENCARKVIAWLDDREKSTTLKHCSRCTQPDAQPEEGTTFPPKEVYRRAGKPVMNARSGGPRKFGTHDYVHYQESSQSRNEELAELYKREPLEHAQGLLRETSARKLQLQHPELGAYETVRKARIRVLRFTPDGDRAPDPAKSATTRSIDNKPKRKCPHGQHMHPDDRGGKSRHCFSCYTHGRRSDTQQLGNAA